MAIAQFTAQFKTVSDKSTSIHAGKKRDDLKVDYMALEASDIAGLDHEQVAKVLNANLIDFGKKLIAEQSDNWDFKPEAKDISFEEFYADFSTPSKRGNRILSKANLTAYAKQYGIYLVQSLGKSDASAKVNMQMIELKFAPLVTQPDALVVIGGNLADFKPSEDLTTVHDALIELLTNLMTPQTPQDIKSML